MLKYSGIVCQQLARSPVKRVRTYSPQSISNSILPRTGSQPTRVEVTKTTKIRVMTSPKKEPVAKDGVVYDPMPSIGEKDKERALAQAEVADRAVRGNLLTSAYGFSKPLKTSVVVAPSPSKEAAVKPRPPARLPPQSSSPMKSPTKATAGRVRPLPSSRTLLPCVLASNKTICLVKSPSKTAQGMVTEKPMTQASATSLDAPRLPLEPRLLQTAPTSPRPAHSPTTRSPRKEAWRSPAPSPRQTPTPRKATPRKEPKLTTRPVNDTAIAANVAANVSEEPELVTRDDVAREVLIATAIVSSALDDAMVQAANEALRRSFAPPPSTPLPPDVVASIAKDGIFAKLFQEVPRSPVRRESKDTDDVSLATMSVLAAETKDDDAATSMAMDESVAIDEGSVTSVATDEDTATSVAMALLAKQLTLAWVSHAAASVADDTWQATSSALSASIVYGVCDDMIATIEAASLESMSVDASARDDATSDGDASTAPKDMVDPMDEETTIARHPSASRIDAHDDMDLEAAFSDAMASETTGDADARPSDLEDVSIFDEVLSAMIDAGPLDASSQGFSSSHPHPVASAEASIAMDHAPEMASDASSFQAQLETPEEAFDHTVLISIMAGHMVRAWMQVTMDEIVSFGRPHERDLETQVPDSNVVPDLVSPLVSARDITPSTQPSLPHPTLNMATQLVHAWIDAAVRAMATQCDSALSSIVVIEISSEQAPVVSVVDPPGLDACPPRSQMEEDDSMRSQVAVSILAGHLVRAWISDTMEEVAWFTCRSHEHDNTTAATSDDVPSSSSLDDATPSSRPDEAADAPTPLSAMETIDTSEINALDMTAHDGEVAVAFVASRLVRAWLYETCRVIAERALSSTPASLAPLEVCDDSAPVVVLPVELFDDNTTKDDLVNVAASVLAGQVVRGWLYETMDEVAQRLSARSNEPPVVATDFMVTPTPSSVVTVTKESLLAADETKSDDETQNDDLVNVTVSVMAGQLARAWVYETMNEVVQFSARRHEHAADASSCAEMVALSPKVSVHVEPERCDDTSVAISILAGQLVRAWLYETMDEVVQFSARRHEHTADASACAVTEAPAPLVVVDDAPPTLSVAPVVVADAELETSDDTIVAVSILAGQLVNAWVYETMGNIIVQRSGEPSESMDNIVQQSTPQHELETHESQGVLQPSLTTDEVLPSNDGTADVESFANDINDASRIVATSVMAGQLVRVWVYDVMDNIVQRSTQQLASPHDVVDDAPLVAIDAPSTGDNLDDNSSEESRDDTVAMSILAGQLVRAWTYDVMDEIVQLTARRHEHAMDATSCAVADTVMADTVMADTVVAETISTMDETLQRVPSKFEVPSEEARAIEPSASEMDEINHAVAASMLSGQLVRGWLHEALARHVALQLSESAPVTASLAPAVCPPEVLYLEETLLVSRLAGPLVRSWFFEGIESVVWQQLSGNKVVPVAETLPSATLLAPSVAYVLLTPTDRSVYDSVARLFTFLTWAPTSEVETTPPASARACGDARGSAAWTAAVAMVEEAVYYGVQAAFNHASQLPPDAGSTEATCLNAINDLVMDAAVEPETSLDITLTTTVDVPPIANATEMVTVPSVVWTSWDAPVYDSVAKLLSFVAWFSLPIASVPQVARAAPALPLLSLPPTPRDEPDEWNHARDIATSRLAGNLVRSWLHAAVYEPKSARAPSVVDAAVDKDVDSSSHADVSDAALSDAKTVLTPPVTNTDSWTEAARSIATQHVLAWLTDAALSVATRKVATNARDIIASQHEPASDAAKAVASGAGIPKGSFATLQYLGDVASLAATVAQSCIDAACHVLCTPAVLPSVAKYSDEPEPEACTTDSAPFTDIKDESTGMRPTALAATRAVDAWVQAALVTCSAAIQPDKSSSASKTLWVEEGTDTDPVPTKTCLADVDDLANVARQFARAATFDAVAMLAAGILSPSLSTDTKAKAVVPTETLVEATSHTATEAASATQENNDLAPTQTRLDALRLDMATQLVHAWIDAAVRAMATQCDSALSSIVVIEISSEQAPVVSVVDPPGLDACPPRSQMEEDDSMRSQVAVSILAGHLVRAWISDTMEEVAWFTCRSHEHDNTTAATSDDVPSSSSLDDATPSSRPDEAADAPTPLSAMETIDTSEINALDMTAHDGEVAVAFVASRLVRAWLYETCRVIAERALSSTPASLAPLEVCDDSAPVVVLPVELFERQYNQGRPRQRRCVSLGWPSCARMVVRDHGRGRSTAFSTEQRTPGSGNRFHGHTDALISGHGHEGISPRCRRDQVR